MTHRLAADIGGTKTLLALRDHDTLVARQRFENSQWPNLETMIQHYVQEAGSPPLTDACLAVAGPVVNNTCVLSNLAWVVSGSQISAALGQIPVQLINDFAAVGYGLVQLPDHDLHMLQPGIPQPQAPIAFLGAGTGLGEGFAIWQQDHYRVYASEGGHCDFAPRGELEYRLLQFLQQRFTRVSVERVVSGMGLRHIYDFLAQDFPDHYNPDIDTAEISRGALQHRDPLSEKTLQLFIHAYGAEAGNLALKTLPRGGLYIAGGIAPKVLPLFESYRFLDAFLDKGRMSPLLQEIPVSVVLNAQVGLLGAAFYPEAIAS
ncbi:MAG: glucokinase [Synechococcales cyanobacterium]